MARFEALGGEDEVALAQGRVRYRARGSGPTLLFLHGLLVNGDLWRKVVPLLAGDHRCITPDLPLGAHDQPLERRADLSPPGVAALVANLIEALELEDVTVVGNDTGGAFAQLLVTRRPERIGRLVLTPCDAFQNFLPPAFRHLQLLARVPGSMALTAAALRALPHARLHRLPLAFGLVTKRPLERAALESYVTPLGVHRGVRRDLAKVLRGISPRHTRAAALELTRLRQPALIAWAREDRVFPPDHGRRLATLIPDARLEWIEDSYSFVPEDAPERLAELVAGFVRSS